QLCVKRTREAIKQFSATDPRGIIAQSIVLIIEVRISDARAQRGMVSKIVSQAQPGPHFRAVAPRAQAFEISSECKHFAEKIRPEHLPQQIIPRSFDALLRFGEAAMEFQLLKCERSRCVPQTDKRQISLPV